MNTKPKSDRTRTRVLNRGLLAVGFALIAAVALLARGERAAAQTSSTPTPIQTYYLTAFEENFFNLLDNAEPGAPDSPVTSRTKIVIREAPAIVYFEHYEDGYAVDIAKPRPEELWSPNNPGGVQIWGDGDLSNGAIPGDPENDDLFTSDQIISLVNTVSLPYDPSTMKYGGQDKVASSTGIAITRLLWAAGSNSLFGGAHELYPTKLWGDSYTAPVGCDTPTTVAEGIFDYTMFAVQAKSNNTTFEIDIDRDGTADITETLNEGEEWGPDNLSSGYECGVTSLVQGATVRTTDPTKKIQVVLYMGKDGPPSFQMRDVSLLADGIADYQYYLPVGFTEDEAGDTGRERAFIYNTSDSTVYLRCDSLTGSAGSQTVTTNNYTIAGKSTAGVDVISYTGAHCYATTTLGGTTPDETAKLVGIAAMDVPFDGDGTVSAGTGMDWTYSLVPSKRLGNQIIVGEGLGQDPGNLPIRENGNPIWVTTACNNPADTTYIYVDWDRNGTPDDADLNGDGDWDDVDPYLGFAEADVSNGIPMSRLKAVRLWNNGGNSTWSKDQSGAYVYSLTAPNVASDDDGTGGCAFAAAWGQDPRIASFAAPGLDVGTTIPPQPPVDFYKEVELLIDADGNGFPGPGDTLRFTINAANDSLNQIDGVRIFDDIPANTTYVPNSTEKDITDDFDLWIPVPDDATGTAFPIDLDPNGPLVSLDALKTGSIWAVRFNVTLDPPGNPPYLEVTNSARFWGNEGFVTENASATLSLYSRIGDTIWYDLDGDGIQDAGEPGIEGVSVTLYPPADVDAGEGLGQPVTVTTDAFGKYAFNLLPPGDYRIEVTPPTGLTQTGDPDGGADSTSAVSVILGESNLAQDFGYLPKGALGDRIWYDLDGDGSQDALEPGIPNQVVMLEADFDEDGTYDATFYTVTDTEGRYLFEALPPGDYRVTVVDPVSGTTNTGDPDGTKNGVHVTDLDANERDLSIDFGYRPPAGTIGDTIWYDLDGDGIQDLNEPGIPGVTVTLTKPDGSTVTAVTDDQGRYLFTNLPDGDYAVTVTPPVGVTQTGDPDGTLDAAGSVTLEGGSIVLTQDFGFQPTGQIGDTVYLDTDGDGTQDVGEDGISGIQVRLEADLNGDDIIDATYYTTTDADGKYLFENLPQGDYIVTVMNPLGGARNTGDPDDGTPDMSYVTLDSNGDTDLDQDFGYQVPAGIGDRIWYDINGDGVQDPGEPGVPGVTVVLTPAVGEPITTVTGPDGNYYFPNLPAGDYTVTVTPPADTTQTGDPDATPDDNSSVTLPSGGVNLAQDFGYQPIGKIGDFIWADDNEDGIQDTGEKGIPNLTVTLYADYDGDNVVDATFVTTTDSQGKYLFENLPPGSYTVTVDPPDGATLTYDPDGLHPHSAEVVLTPADMEDLDQDFGYFLPGPGAIGDRVWYDLDGDGVQDPLEPGVPYQQVKLEADYDGDGTIDETFYTVTDTEGRYLFDELEIGDYTVTVIDPLTGMTQTYDPDGTEDDTADLTIGPAEQNLDQDFGYQVANVIGDTIWYDLDGDSIQDLNEPGIPGVTVTLTPVGGGSPVTLVTDDHGRYLFTNVPPGDYTVTVTPPPGVIATGDPDGTLDSVGSVTLKAGEAILTQDFGYQPTGTIGDTIYLDTDGDGIQGAGEPGIEGVTVQLEADLNQDGIVDAVFMTTTDADGKYLFENLPKGDYTVTVLNPPAESTNTGDPNGGSDSTSEVTLATNSSTDLDQDFGYQIPGGAIGDRIWYDIDGDGIQDPDEPGVPGVVVTLTPPSGPAITVQTDENGNYLFTGLPAGSYTIQVTPAADTTQTGDPDATLNNRSTVTLAADEINLDQDFGYQPEGQIGDYIWMDRDKDGKQDADENGIEGLTVTLYADYDRDNVVDATFVTTTDEDGKYLFDNLAPGAYTVTVSTPPADSELTYDPDGLHPHSAEVDLNEEDGMVDLEQDFGYYIPLPVTVGDRVWYDLDGDGVQDPLEPGVPGQQVKAEVDTDGDGIIDETFYTVTDTEGRYLFTIPPGDITVTVMNPLTGMTQTGDPDGTKDNVGETSLLAEGEDLTLDFGYKVENVVGDTIWYDLDGDGIQDLNEPGIPGVTVTLTPVDGGSPVTLVTDDHGRYLFTNVAPGDYTITVTPPAGTTQTGDPDGTLSNSSTVTLIAGSVILDQDFGYQPTGKIGDTIYLDTNGNGTQGAGEPGIEGVTVQMEADLNQDGIVDAVFETTTDADGKYLFENLPKGDYTVTVLNPPAGSANTGDPDGGSNSTSDVTLASNSATNLDQDFGYQIPGGAIGDRIWYDIDGDGVQDPDEPGVPSVVVTLTPPSGPAITVKTDENGNYLFTGLPAGNYTITVEQPADTTQTGDPDATLNSSSTVTLAADEINLDQDFGYQPEGQIGDYVWLDKDKDGVHDADEVGIPDLTITLYADYDRDNVVDAVFVTTTDEDGKYLFDNLPPGAYTVTVSTIPEDSTLTYDPDGLHPHSAEIDLNEEDGMVDLDQDFGYYIPLPVIVGDRVWYDLDGDGVQDPLEPGIPGQQMKAEVDLDFDGIIDETFYTVTDTEGRYLFNIPAGDITVTVVNPLTGLTQTGDPDGTKDNTGETSLLPDEEDLTLDFGFQPPPNTIGDTIWYDLDGDGIQDLNEPGIPGVTVTLTPAGGGTPVTLVTDENGRYLFTNVPPGDYTVTVTPPPGVTATGDPDGTTDSKSTITMNDGQVILDQDFGYQPTGKIGDTIYLDTDGNGTQGAGEPGIAGVLVQLEADLNQDGIVDAVFNTTTDANGKYLFENLPKGDYTVTVVTPPTGSTNTGDPDSGSDSTSKVTLATNSSTNLNQDFGYQIPGGAIGDRIWYDLDGDGVQDLGEPGVPGVEVTLTTPTGTLTAVTDENGNYLFTGLPAGNYTITVEEPADTTQTGDPDATLNSSSTITLAADEINLDQDFGYQPQGQIGDRVWLDKDKDGAQDVDEVGIPNLTITLYADYDRDNVVDEVFVTTTDENGNYLFDNLAPGAYTVTVSTVPEDSTLTYDPDGLHPHSAEVDLNEDDGMVRLDQDFGYYIPLNALVGDRVWYDLDGDGVQDPLEPGIPGQQMKAEVDFDFDGFVDLTFYTVTDTEGRYLFDIPAGDVTVTVVNPLAGATQTGDPDGTKDGTAETSVLPTDEELTLDFGYKVENVIGDTIWYDMDGDGIQDLNEPGIPGVTVTLTPVGGGTPVTVVTDANGRYLFTNVPPGDYTVTVTPPANLKQTGDPDGVMNHSSVVTVEAGSVILDQDFGYQPTGQIGDRVYLDRNGNGKPNSGEPGLPGIIVQLDADFNKDGIIDATFTTVTDSRGGYLFNNLPQGDYTVTLVNPPAESTNTADPNGGGDFISQVTLPKENVKNLQQDFGLRAPGVIGDRVWYDIDGDGIQDLGEPGVPGVSVTLTTPNGTITTETDENGNYLFPNVPAGSYTVKVTPPADTTQTGDPDKNKDNQSTVVLKNGDTNLAQDFGYRPIGKIGDRVWSDLDQDGVQDPDEVGFAGLTITLYADYDGDNVVDATFVTKTDANGNYLFENLPPGDYTVTVSTPPNDRLTYDPDGLHPHSAELSLVPGAMERLDQDFGYYQVNVCVNDSGVFERTDILGQGMGSPFFVDSVVTVNIPDYLNVARLYGQVVAKDTGAVDGYARFQPARGKQISVKQITSPAFQQNAEFWWGANLTPANSPYWRARVLNGLKFPYQPRAFVLFPTYNTPTLRWNFFQTYADSNKNTVYWAPSWTPTQTFNLSLPGPLIEARDITVKVALSDNDVDERPLVVTVNSIGPSPVTLTQAPIGPDTSHLLNILTFTLEQVPVGTTGIEVVLSSPIGTGDSGTITGIAANMSCYGN